MDEDDQTKKTASYTIGQNLELLSVDEIAEIVSELKQEIVRLEDAKNAKSAHMSAAEALFKS